MKCKNKVLADYNQTSNIYSIIYRMPNWKDYIKKACDSCIWQQY